MCIRDSLGFEWTNSWRSWRDVSDMRWRLVGASSVAISSMQFSWSLHTATPFLVLTVLWGTTSSSISPIFCSFSNFATCRSFMASISVAHLQLSDFLYDWYSATVSIMKWLIFEESPSFRFTTKYTIYRRHRGRRCHESFGINLWETLPSLPDEGFFWTKVYKGRDPSALENIEFCSLEYRDKWQAAYPSSTTARTKYNTERISVLRPSFATH